MLSVAYCICFLVVFSNAFRIRTAQESYEKIPLTNADNTLNTATVFIGTPQEQFSMALDISFNNMWVPVKNSNVSGVAVFVNSTSSTFKANGTVFSYEYPGNEIVKGVVCEDNVQLGNIKFTKFGFGAIQTVPKTKPQVDGLIGFGYPGYSVDGLPSLLNVAVSKHSLQPVFSLYLNSQKNGALYLGGENPSLRSGSFSYVSAIENTNAQWQIHINNLHLGFYSSYSTTQNGHLSTTVRGIYGPKNQVHVIYQYLCDKIVNGQTCYVACERVVKLNHFIITVGTHNVSIPATSYVLPATSPSDPIPICEVAIYINPTSSNWILGNSFLQSQYVLFDWEKKRVGFANKA